MCDAKNKVNQTGGFPRNYGEQCDRGCEGSLLIHCGVEGRVGSGFVTE